jgi:hypothetical protein
MHAGDINTDFATDIWPSEKIKIKLKSLSLIRGMDGSIWMQRKAALFRLFSSGFQNRGRRHPWRIERCLPLELSRRKKQKKLPHAST